MIPGVIKRGAGFGKHVFSSVGPPSSALSADRATPNMAMLRETHMVTITITTHFTLFEECIYNADAQ